MHGKTWSEVRVKKEADSESDGDQNSVLERINPKPKDNTIVVRMYAPILGEFSGDILAGEFFYLVGTLEK